jgi:hypothetical protein
VLGRLISCNASPLQRTPLVALWLLSFVLALVLVGNSPILEWILMKINPWEELERKLIDTNAKLSGQPFPLDHLYNLVAGSCARPFNEADAMSVAPVLARNLSVEQIAYLIAEARQVCREASDGLSESALGYLRERVNGMDAEARMHTPVDHVAGPKSWANLHSLSTQGALLLALMWTVLPPDDVPEAQA